MTLPAHPAPRVTRIDRVAMVMAVVYAAAMFAWYCVWNAAMAERSADTATAANCLWNAAHGNGLRSGIEGGVHHLAIHFSPILYLLVPVYALWPEMHPVHALVCAGTAAAGLVLHQMAREEFGDNVARCLMLAFLLHPTIALQNFMEFHEQALLPFPMMMALWAMRRRARGQMLLWCLVVLTLREDNVLFVGMLGLVALATARDWRTAVGLFGLCGGFAATYVVVSRQLLGHNTLPPVFANNYGALGGSPGAVLHAILTEPLRVARHILGRAHLSYLAQLTFPLLGVVGFGAPVVLAMLPQLALILLSDPPARFAQVRMHYSLVPAIAMYAASLGTLRLLGGAAGRRPLGRVPVALAVAAVMLAASAVTVPVWARRAVGRLNPNVAEIRAILAVVPDSASVSAPGYLLNRLANRRSLGLLWTEQDLTRNEVVILEEERLRFYEGSSVDLPWSERAAATLRAAGYAPLLERDGWHVWRRTGAAPAGATPS